MRINELVDKFEIYANNEEQRLIEKLTDPVVFENLEPREQWVVQNMLRKSLVKRYTREGQIYIVKNNT